MDERSARAGAASRREPARAPRRQGDHRADGPNGRRGPQPQPGRHPHVVRELLPELVEAADPVHLAEVVRFVAGNDHFFLNLVMPAGKLQTGAASGIAGSSVVTTMTRNGTDFGIQVSGLADAWFTGPAQVPKGLYL